MSVGGRKKTHSLQVVTSLVAFSQSPHIYHSSGSARKVDIGLYRGGRLLQKKVQEKRRVAKKKMSSSKNNVEQQKQCRATKMMLSSKTILSSKNDVEQ